MEYNSLETDVSIISKRRDEWINKLEDYEARAEEFSKGDNQIVASAYEFMIGRVKEFIEDLGEDIRTMKSLNSYNQKCINLINNINK
jgi:hypothetical protein